MLKPIQYRIISNGFRYRVQRKRNWIWHDVNLRGGIFDKETEMVFKNLHDAITFMNETKHKDMVKNLKWEPVQGEHIK